tara:strand:+ start:2728 stop:3678 length:951 start_codon:yes stop_codon:yes gene_type:complete
VKNPRFIDLFCGIGGFRLGLEKVGAECVFSADNDPYCCKVYFDNFGEDPFHDLTTIDPNMIPDHEILCAGFPCQPFSIGGFRKGFEDTRGTLFFDILRILKKKKTKSFILENVKGITNHDKGNTIKVIRQELDKMGYNLFEKVLNVSDYGLPQNRERWYCIGFRKDLEISDFNFPKKIKLKRTLNDIVNTEVKDHKISSIAYNHLRNNIKKYNLKTHSIDYKNNYTIVTEARKTRASIRRDGISPCLTAKMGTGGNNVPMIYELKRKLTVKECLALMGFPNKYIIRNNYSQSYKQIGNSICVSIVEKLGKELINKI